SSGAGTESTLVARIAAHAHEGAPGGFASPDPAVMVTRTARAARISRRDKQKHGDEDKPDGARKPMKHALIVASRPTPRRPVLLPRQRFRCWLRPPRGAPRRSSRLPYRPRAQPAARQRDPCDRGQSLHSQDRAGAAI